MTVEINTTGDGWDALNAFTRVLERADLPDDVKQHGYIVMVGLIHGLDGQTAPWSFLRAATEWAALTGAQNAMGDA